MADAATNNSPILQSFIAQKLGITPDRQKQIMSAQQQEAMANALLQQGSTPLDTNNRQIGGVAYHISPLEGLAKLADTLSGKYQQSNANDALANALSPASGSPSAAPAAPAAPVSSGGNMLANADGSPSDVTTAEGLAGNRAFVDLYKANNPNAVDPLQQGTIGGITGLYPASTLRNASMGAASPAQQPQGIPAPQPPQGAPPAMQGLPSSGQPMPPVPPVSASALQPPTPNPSAGIQINAPAPPAYGKVELTPQQQAALAAQTAGATKMAEASGAGAATQAEDTAKNLADAQKTYAVAASSLPRAMQRFGQLRQAAANASSGGGVSEEDPGGTFSDYSRNAARTALGQYIEPKTATANQVIDQATKQGVLTELGPQLQGLKGNKFLEGIASGASGLNPADPAPVKINAINGLQDQYISNMKAIAQQQRSYGDPKAPTDLDMAKLISQNADPNIPVSVIDPQGRLGRVSPAHLVDLVNAGGQIR